MTVLRIDASADLYVKAPISAKVNGATIDVTALTVSVAWKKPGDRPTAGDFSAATWDTDATTNPTTYLAKRLVSAGDLAVGQWVMWVKVVRAPETFIEPAGMFEVV